VRPFGRFGEIAVPIAAAVFHCGVDVFAGDIVNADGELAAGKLAVAIADGVGYQFRHEDQDVVRDRATCQHNVQRGSDLPGLVLAAGKGTLPSRCRT